MYLNILQLGWFEARNRKFWVKMGGGLVAILVAGKGIGITVGSGR